MKTSYLVIVLLSFIVARAQTPGTATQTTMNRDPLEELGGVNLYFFVANGTLYYIDPFGLSFGDWVSGFGEGWSDGRWPPSSAPRG